MGTVSIGMCISSYHMQGQNLVLLLQLPAGLPKITIFEARQNILGPSSALEIFKISVAIWATVQIFRGPGKF